MKLCTNSPGSGSHISSRVEQTTDNSLKKKAMRLGEHIEKVFQSIRQKVTCKNTYRM